MATAQTPTALCERWDEKIGYLLFSKCRHYSGSAKLFGRGTFFISRKRESKKKKSQIFVRVVEILKKIKEKNEQRVRDIIFQASGHKNERDTGAGRSPSMNGPLQEHRRVIST